MRGPCPTQQEQEDQPAVLRSARPPAPAQVVRQPNALSASTTKRRQCTFGGGESQGRYGHGAAARRREAAAQRRHREMRHEPLATQPEGEEHGQQGQGPPTAAIAKQPSPSPTVMVAAIQRGARASILPPSHIRVNAAQQRGQRVKTAEGAVAEAELGLERRPRERNEPGLAESGPEGQQEAAGKQVGTGQHRLHDQRNMKIGTRQERIMAVVVLPMTRLRMREWP